MSIGIHAKGSICMLTKQHLKVFNRAGRLECEARKTRRKKAEKQALSKIERAWFSGFRLHVDFEPACFSALSVSLDPPLAGRVVNTCALLCSSVSQCSLPRCGKYLGCLTRGDVHDSISVYIEGGHGNVEA